MISLHIEWWRTLNCVIVVIKFQSTWPNSSSELPLELDISFFKSTVLSLTPQWRILSSQLTHCKLTWNLTAKLILKPLIYLPVNSQHDLTLWPCCESSVSLHLTPWACCDLFMRSTDLLTMLWPIHEINQLAHHVVQLLGSSELTVISM